MKKLERKYQIQRDRGFDNSVNFFFLCKISIFRAKILTEFYFSVNSRNFCEKLREFTEKKRKIL